MELRGGVDVGVFISKSIVESRGGAIAYRANAPRGSIFEFELPLWADERSAPGAPMADVSAAR